MKEPFTPARQIFANMAAELDTLAASTTNPAEAAIYAAAANKARNNELP
jgi:hypothetical protein